MKALRPWIFCLGALAGVLLCSCLACERPKENGEIAKLKKSVSELQAKVDGIAAKQQEMTERQDRNHQETLKALEEIKPGVVQLKRLYEFEKEREILETPTEKVRRAVREVRSLSVAIESFQTDANLFPEKNAVAPYKMGDLRLCRVADIATQISPNYLRPLTGWDPWGNPYLYWASEKRDHFLVMCTGLDGTIDADSSIPHIMKAIQKEGYTTPAVSSSCFETDIVWYDDCYIQYPQGPMRKCAGQE